MIRVYDVQTFYGTEQKTFLSQIHAQEYHRELCERCECVDPIKMRIVTEEEFIYEDIAD